MRTLRRFGVALLLALLAVGLSYPISWAEQTVDNYFAQPTGGGTDNVLNLGGTWQIAGTAVSSSAAELNYTDIATLGVQEASKVVTTDANVNSGIAKVTELHIGTSGSETQVNATAPELNQLAGQGSANSKGAVSEGCTFTEDATNATHTCTVTLPADSWLLNIQFVTSVLWTDAETSLSIGDADDPNGWFDDVDLAATDLLVGEVLDFSNAENWGGTQGVYLVAATGRKGQAIAAYTGVYVPTASEVIGVVTMTTSTGTAGRSHLLVTYTSPTLVAATAAP